MLYSISNKFPEDLHFDKEKPLISLYQPTHRSFPDNKQDPIVFKNLLSDIKDSLEKLEDFDDIEKIMAPFYEIEEDEDFWNYTSDGLAIFATPNKCIVYMVDTPVKELSVVADSFHIKPLLKAYQSARKYHLLGLSRENFYLYEGDQFGLKEVEIHKDTPRTKNEVLGFDSTDPHLSYGSYGGAEGPAMYHGHGDSQNEIDIDTEKYFRYVDKFVLDNYSNELKQPLILLALKEHQGTFKNISNNPFLHDATIDQSIDSMELKEIKKEVSKIVASIQNKKIEDQIAEYNNAKAHELGSCDLEEVSKAVFQSRVKTLFIEDEKIIPGEINLETGQIRHGNIENPKIDDLLDDLAQLALTYDTEVIVLDKDKMPSDTGIAAIYRY